MEGFSHISASESLSLRCSLVVKHHSAPESWHQPGAALLYCLVVSTLELVLGCPRSARGNASLLWLEMVGTPTGCMLVRTTNDHSYLQSFCWGMLRRFRVQRTELMWKQLVLVTVAGRSPWPRPRSVELSLQFASVFICHIPTVTNVFSCSLLDLLHQSISIQSIAPFNPRRISTSSGQEQSIWRTDDHENHWTCNVRLDVKCIQMVKFCSNKYAWTWRLDPKCQVLRILPVSRPWFLLWFWQTKKQKEESLRCRNAQTVFQDSGLWYVWTHAHTHSPWHSPKRLICT